MKHSEIRKRLDKVEEALTPQQATLVAVQKTLARFESPRDCDAWLRDNPGALLFGDPAPALSALCKKLSKEPPEVVIEAVARNLRQRVFLAGLWCGCNHYVADLTDRKLLWLALIASKLEALVGRSEFSGEAPEAHNCGHEIAELLRVLLETHFAIVTIATRYFDGHAVLFREYDHKLRERIEVAETFADLYNKLPEVKHGQNPPLRIDVEEIKRTAKKTSKAVANWLISQVNSNIDVGLAAAERAREISAALLRNM